MNSEPQNDLPRQAPGDEPPAPASDRRRPWLRRMLYGIAALPILAGLLLALIPTGPGLRFAGPTIERVVSAALQGRFEMGDIHGSLWTGLTIDRLLVENTSGLSIDGRRLQLEWSPLSLLRKVIQVERLGADSLTVVLPRTGARKAPEERPGRHEPLTLPLAIRLEQLDLPEFRLVDPASGRRFSYNITASGTVGENLSTKFDLAALPLADGGDELRARLAFTAADKKLQVDITGRFPRAGILMTLARVPAERATDATISLLGDGSAEQWQGNLKFAAADLAELAGEIGLRLREKELGFTLSGTLGAVGSYAERLPIPLRGPTTLHGAGQFALETNRLALTKIKLAKPNLLSLSGSADLDLAASRLVADLETKLDSAASTLLGDTVQWQGLALKAHAEGDLTMPETKLTITGQSVATPVVTIGDLLFTASGARMADRGERFAVTVQGKSLGNVWTNANLAGILGEQLDIEAKADIAADFSKIIVEHLEAASPGVQLTGKAELDGRGNVSAADLQADVDDLSIFTAASGLQLSGAAQLAASNIAWGAETGGRAELKITGRQLAFGQADLDRLVGPEPVISAQLELSPRKDLAVKLDRLDTAMADGTFSLHVTQEFTKMQLDGELTVQPGAVPPVIGVSLAQPAHLEVSLAGSPTAPRGEIRTSVPALEARGKRFADLQLDSTISWTDEKILSLRNRLDFALNRKTYQLQADGLMVPERLQLTMALKGKGVDLKGKLELPGYRMPADGSINLLKLDAGLLGDLGAPLAAGGITAKIDFRPSKGRQRIDFKAGAKSLQLTGSTEEKPKSIEQLQLRGCITDALKQPVLDTQLEAAGIAIGPATGERLQASLRGALTRMHATVEAKGRYRKRLPMTLAASAEIAMQRKFRLAADKLTIDIGSERIALRQPLLLTRSEAGVVSGQGSFSVGKGQLDSDVRLAPGRSVEVNTAIRDIDLDPWGEMFAVKGLSGTLSLIATLNERAGGKPEAQVTADVKDIRVTAAEHLPPLSLRLDGSLKSQRATADLTLGSPDARMLQVAAEVPLNLSLLKGRATVDAEAPISLHASIDGEIEQFWPYVPLPDHDLAGRLKLAATLSGNLENPVWDGVLNLQKGRYEHLRFGTLLRDLRLDGRFDRRSLRIAEISATDGGSGKMTGKADVEMNGTASLAYQGEMTMRKMALTRMDELQLWSDVDLNVAGDGHAARLNSQVTVYRGEIDLGVAFPPAVPQIEVENLPETKPKPKKKNDEEEAEEETPGAFTTDLKVTVKVPARLFVRGKGLDSEWAGRLDVSGSATNPVIKGELHARRGQLDVIGKDFRLRDSKIIFTGGLPPDPLLAIAGVYTTSELAVTASLAGPVSQAKLTLSSEPELPQDEILSRVMFGKSQGNLSPVEAIQLASAASSLLGVGGNLDIVGSLRKSLNMDVLRVEGGETGPALQVGKYLSEGVFVGTKQGLTSGSTGVVMEIELTPILKVTNETDEIGNKTGLQFKWDY